MKGELATSRAECDELRSEITKLETALRAESASKERAKNENDKLRAALDSFQAAVASEDRSLRETDEFYEGLRTQLDGTAATGAASPAETTPTSAAAAAAPELRAELQRKEADLTVRFLKTQNAKLRAELEALRVLEGENAKEMEMMVQNRKLVEQAEVLEEHCLMQQNVRRDAQLEAARLQTELTDAVARATRDATDGHARECALQAELAAAQRKGVAAQRQIDELRAAAAAGELSSPTADADAEAQQQQQQPPLVREALLAAEREAEAAAARLTLITGELQAERRRCEELQAGSAALTAELQRRDEAEAEKAEEDSAALRASLTETTHLLEEKLVEVAALKAGAEETRLLQGAKATLAARVRSLEAEVSAAGERVVAEQSRAGTLEDEVLCLRGKLKAAEERHGAEAEQCVSLSAQLQLKQAELAALEAASADAAAASASADKRAAAAAAAAEEVAAAAADAAAARQAEHDAAVEKLGARVEELAAEGEWLQREWVKTRAALGAAERQAKVEAAAQAEAAKKVKKENRRLLAELRGDGGSCAAFVPLPDHRGRSDAEVHEIVSGGLETMAQLLTTLEGLEEPTDSTDQECAFLRALSNKITLMLQQVQKDQRHSERSARFQSLSARSAAVLDRLLD